MKLRARHTIVPALALLGILVALYLLFMRAPPPVEAPLPTAPAQPPAAPAPEPPASSLVSPPPETPKPPDADAIRDEIKRTLHAMYTAEQSYYQANHRFTTDLDELGYMPDPGIIHFKAGFLRPYTPENSEENERPDFMSFDEFEKNPIYKDIQFSPEAHNAHLEDAGRYCHQGCTASANAFEIALISVLNGKSEVWTINERHSLVQETAP